MNSGEYRRKFDAISNNPELNRLLYQLAKIMLTHRSGTLYEDTYWIDLDTLKIVAEESGDDFEHQIVYSKKTKEEILKYDNLITIHTHPNSFPPSIADINSNYIMGYREGIVIGHNGNVFKYSADEEIREGYYELVVADYLKDGYNKYDAHMKAYEELQMNFKISMEEVITHGK